MGGGGGGVFFFFQAEDGIRDIGVTGVQTCALPILQPFEYPHLRSSFGYRFVQHQVGFSTLVSRFQYSLVHSCPCVVD